MAQESLRGDADSKPRGGSGGRADESMSEVWTILSHLVTGIGVFGLAGWGMDALFGTRWVLLIGLLLGGAAAIALIYIRYLYEPSTPPSNPRPGPLGQEDRKEQHG